MKKIQDHYYNKARKEGYAARSTYKLQEMDRKFRLLKKGQCVLDLGCSPGSWLQYTATKVFPKGRLVGLDLKPVTIKLPGMVEIHQKDIFEINNTIFKPSEFDLLMSDMAPSTSGIRSVDSQRSYDLNAYVLKISKRILKPNGTLIVKGFQGEPLESLKKEFSENFKNYKLFKPHSSRNKSIEIYLLGFNFVPQGSPF